MLYNIPNKYRPSDLNGARDLNQNSTSNRPICIKTGYS